MFEIKLFKKLSRQRMGPSLTNFPVTTLLNEPNNGSFQKLFESEKAPICLFWQIFEQFLSLMLHFYISLGRPIRPIHLSGNGNISLISVSSSNAPFPPHGHKNEWFLWIFFWMKWNVSKIKSIILAQRRFKQRVKEKESRNGGLHSAEVAFLLLTQQPQVWMLAFPKIYFDVAVIH